MERPLRVLALPYKRLRDLQPYNFLLYSHIEKLGHVVEDATPRHAFRGNYEILHTHWPERHISQKRWIKALFHSVVELCFYGLCRLRGMRLIWTAHNIASHAGLHPGLEGWYRRRLYRRLDGVLHLSEWGKQEIEKRHPELRSVPSKVVALGHYRPVYPNEVSPAEARQRLGLAADAKVLLFTGAISRYKGVPALIDAFRGLDDPRAVLLVTGRSQDAELIETIESGARRDPRIRTRLEFLPVDEIQLYMNAADLVVLPYERILNSASVLLGLGFDRPVLAPALGALPEVESEVGSDWLRLYPPGEFDARTLASALEWAKAPRAGRAPLEWADWDRIAGQTVELYRAALRGSAAASAQPGQ